MAASQKKKKARVDQATIDQAWDHFRNYIDDDSVDELQELLSLIPLSKQGGATTTTATTHHMLFQSQQDLLPLLLSTACIGIAEEAMSEYLAIAAADNRGKNEVAAEMGTTTTAILTELRTNICRYVAKSLEYYPDNAMTYSLAANFARTYGCCTGNCSSGGGASSTTSAAAARDLTVRWYLKAATSSHELRQMAIQTIEDTENPASDDLKEWLEVLVLNHVCGVECTPSTTSSATGAASRTEHDENAEQEEEEEALSWSSSAVEGTARFMAAMLLSTNNRHDEADQQLQYFPNLSHRIHPNVWRGSTTTGTQPISSSNNNVVVDVVEPSKCPVSFGSPVLPPALYAKLCQVFDKDASYWIESDYGARGYYSYFADLPKKDITNFKPTNAIEEAVVYHLLPRIQCHLGEELTSTIVGYEWWVHTRPVGASLGHNLHFDTDESKLETAADGSISHPFVSSVLYLTAPPVSGATIVFQQTPEATDNAPFAWCSQPVDNSLMVFPGNLLHGVLPCRDAGTSEETAIAVVTNDKVDDDDALINSLLAACGQPPPDDSARHRLSFMVGFWTRRVPDEMAERRLYGPCGPLPAPNEADWVKELQMGYNNNSKQAGNGRIAATESFAAPTPLPCIAPGWQAINANQQGQPEDDVPGLEVPRAIDHRFFVADAPRCFRESLFEPEDDDDDDDGACIIDIDDEEDEDDFSDDEN
jgi:hypothetical protein